MMGGRIAVVEAVRTPWSPRGGGLSGMSTAALGAVAVRDLLLRAAVLPDVVDLVVVGSARSGTSGSLGAEVAFRAGMDAVAPSVSMGDVSGERAIAEACRAILVGDIDTAVAVGVETPSDLQLGLSAPLREAVMGTRRGETAGDKLRAWAGVKATDLRPTTAELRDPITEETLGAAAESVALRFGLDRVAQDAYAVRSHARAFRRAREGAAEVVPVAAPAGAGVIVVERDEGPRAEVTAAELARRAPLAKVGASFSVPASIATVTAGNLSTQADGAAAVLLTRPDLARSRGWTVLAEIDGARFATTDPFAAPRQGGAVALRRLLDEKGESLESMRVAEASEPAASFALALLATLPELDPEALNRWGGSIALGRCSGGSGIRLLGTAARRMAAAGVDKAVVIGGGAAGHGAALLLRAPA